MATESGAAERPVARDETMVRGRWRGRGRTAGATSSHDLLSSDNKLGGEASGAAAGDASTLLAALVERHKHLVVHVKRDPYDVYVGRASAGKPADADPECPWGNPFSTIQAKEREFSNIQKRTLRYLHWLLSDSAMVERVRTELPGRVLGCWCVPRYCHGWVLAAVANCSAEDALLLCTADTNEETSSFSDAVERICADPPLGRGKGKRGDSGLGKGKGRGCRSRHG